MLSALGGGSFDREYLDASGLAKFGKIVPGTSTLFELFDKWPAKDKMIGRALREDCTKVPQIPSKIAEEVTRVWKRWTARW